MTIQHDEDYLSVLRDVIDNGYVKADRTGVGTRSRFGVMRRFDIRDGKIPLLTTKEVKHKSWRVENKWFLSGSGKLAFLLANGVKIWNNWIKKGSEVYRQLSLTDRFFFSHLSKDERLALEKEVADSIDPFIPQGNKELLFKERLEAKADEIGAPTQLLEDADLGPVYGVQWRFWEDTRMVPIEDGVTSGILLERGYAFMGNLIDPTTETEKVAVYHKKFDQIAEALRLLREDPDSRRIIVSAWNPGVIADQALPPCFSAGTLVATPDGYVEIDKLNRGDMVISGTGVPRRVNNVWVTPYEGEMLSIKVRLAGPAINCTPNHPFLVQGRGYVEAKDLKIGDRLGIPKTRSLKDHSFTVELNQGRGKLVRKTVYLFENDYYVLGYFLGNGWASRNDNRVSFSIPNTKLDEILPKIRNTIKVSKKEMPSTTVSTFEVRSHTWADLFREFGHKAHNKRIPIWVMESTLEAKKAFLEGYFAADGYPVGDRVMAANSVSPSIVYGLQRLLAEVGQVASIKFQKKDKTHVIEGRSVNQRDLWHLLTRIPKNRSAVEMDEDYIWTPITAINNSLSKETVYNLDVEEEHTYTVQNLATHNCHTLFQFWTRELTLEERFEAGNRFFENAKRWYEHAGEELPETWKKPVAWDQLLEYAEVEGKVDTADKILDEVGVPRRALSCMLYQRSSDFCLGAPFNLPQYATLTHMFARCVNMMADEFIWVAGDHHVYNDQVELAKGQLERLPTGAEPRVLIRPSAICEDPAQFELDDIVIHGYEKGDYHPFIPYPVAV